MLCEMNLLRATLVIPLLLKLSNMLKMKYDKRKKQVDSF